jgi:hypothetical protein
MKTQYIKKDNGYTHYYADEEMTISHRTDGPAIEYADGSKEWYIEGKCITEAEFNMLHELKEITLEQIAKKFGIELSKLRIKAN